MQEHNLNTFAPRTAATSHQVPSLPPGSRIAVVGAGVFGTWSAIHLQKKNHRVTLIDAWGPANARASSGDETRVIRSTYGGNEFYFDLNMRALHLWRQFEKEIGRTVLFQNGVLWLCHEQRTPLVDESLPFARKHGYEFERLTPGQLRERFPVVATDDLTHAWLDPLGGYLLARESTRLAQELFVAQGGEYVQASVAPSSLETSGMRSLKTVDGELLSFDAYLFACGAWLGKLFPSWLGSALNCTRQEVYYFGVPGRDAKLYEKLPVWVDVDGRDFYYGIPGNQGRGFKVGVDRRGSLFDPTDGDRKYDEQVLAHAHAFMTRRFPGMKNAPLLESRVCPYENSSDGNFIFDAHPSARNVYALGGGSGHGFKHGPALGELIADIISGDKKAPGLFALSGRQK